ncbi:hypothetical protein DsansV1_C05g0053121 [Dioscorea sansibarensis]
MDFLKECGISSCLLVMAFCTRPAVREKEKGCWPNPVWAWPNSRHRF